MEAERLLKLMFDLTSAVSRASTPEEAFASILQSFCAVDDWAIGQVWLPDRDDSCLECSAIWHQSSSGHEEFHRVSETVRFSKGMPLLGAIWATPEVRWVHDIGIEASRFRRYENARALGLSTALIVPVTADDRVIAILEFLAGERKLEDANARKLLMIAAAHLGSMMTRRQAESDLRRSEALFRAVADTAHDAIITIDTSGDIQYVNSEASRMFDQGPQAFLGLPVTSIIPKQLHEAHYEGLANYLRTGDGRLIGRSVVVPARRPDDTEFPVELSLATWTVDDLRFFTAIIRDVSERQRVHAELERALAYEREAANKLIELDQLKNTILDTVSHDLRTPLAAIRVVTDLLQRDALTQILTPEQRQQYLVGLETSAEKMRRLLDDLLDLDRLTSGQDPVQRSEVDLAEVVRLVLEETLDALDGRPLDVDLAPVWADVDVSKVERIVENLVRNAARHTPPGTPIRVSLQAVDDAAILCVDDSGPGVPEAMHEAVFERFKRVPGHYGPGLGLGLSLVARLAALHGGTAWVDDREGGGASFRVRLPLK